MIVPSSNLLIKRTNLFIPIHVNFESYIEDGETCNYWPKGNVIILNIFIEEIKMRTQLKYIRTLRPHIGLYLPLMHAYDVPLD